MRGLNIEIPLHITGFWYSIIDDDPLYSGSLGAGINLKPGIKVRPYNKFGISGFEGSFIYNTYGDAFKLSGFREAGLYIDGPNLLGLGFGLSAGYALAGLMLSNILNGYGKTWFEIGRYVHMAEVRNKTGYGDVIALLTGGLEYRLAPGAPGIGQADRVPVADDVSILVSVTGDMSTPEMLNRYGDLIRDVGPKMYKYFSENPSFERFIETSYKFSREIGMLDSELEDQVKVLIGNYISNGGVLGFHRKKNLLVVYTEKSVSDEVYNLLRSRWRTFIYTIDFCGIKIL